jgi:hypothetical protein
VVAIQRQDTSLRNEKGNIVLLTRPNESAKLC